MGFGDSNPLRRPHITVCSALPQPPGSPDGNGSNSYIFASAARACRDGQHWLRCVACGSHRGGGDSHGAGDHNSRSSTAMRCVTTKDLRVCRGVSRGVTTKNLRDNTPFPLSTLPVEGVGKGGGSSTGLEPRKPCVRAPTLGLGTGTSCHSRRTRTREVKVGRE